MVSRSGLLCKSKPVAIEALTNIDTHAVYGHVLSSKWSATSHQSRYIPHSVENYRPRRKVFLSTSHQHSTTATTTTKSQRTKCASHSLSYSSPSSPSPSPPPSQVAAHLPALPRKNLHHPTSSQAGTARTKSKLSTRTTSSEGATGTRPKLRSSNPSPTRV